MLTSRALVILMPDFRGCLGSNPAIDNKSYNPHIPDSPPLMLLFIHIRLAQSDRIETIDTAQV